jgi:Arc/MetJ-type ribon-helix-helix transcriptional regulator
MNATAPTRRRPKIGATVDAHLLAAVDDWVRRNPGYDRSRVIDEALRLWYEREQERAMEEQYSEPDDVDAEEWRDWQAVRRAAAARSLLPEDAR